MCYIFVAQGLFPWREGPERIACSLGAFHAGECTRCSPGPVSMVANLLISWSCMSPVLNVTSSYDIHTGKHWVNVEGVNDLGTNTHINS